MMLRSNACWKPRPLSQARRFGRYLAITWLMLLVLYGPINLAMAQLRWPQPDAILTLGGRPHREGYAAQFALKHSGLPIWVSSGLAPDRAMPLFRDVGIPERQVHLDYRATDTVTNFTTLVGDLQARHIHHVYLITSDYHMTRAAAIATYVLGSRHIAFTPVVVPSRVPAESALHIGRDVLRSWLWLTTRYTGARLSI